jgi:hypothetical protein
MNVILQWAIQSPSFRKASTFVCGVACGLWFGGMFWREIRGTLEVWGCSREAWMRALLAIIAATAGASSVLLSVANQKRLKVEKEEVQP